MYNRYIPQDASYDRVEHRPEAISRPENSPQGRLHLPLLPGGKDGLSALLSGKSLSGLAKSIRLDGVDSGDVLLALILLYLLIEGEDLEPAFAIGLVLLMGLGDRDKGGT